MNYVTGISTVALVVVVALNCRNALAAPPTDNELREILRQRIAAGRASGIVVGIVDSSGRRIVASGRTALEGGTEVNGDTVFEIGSVTKVFTSTLLADMARRGEVSLNDPISKYLPSTVKAPKRNGREITLLDLSQHRSGLPRLPDNLVPGDDFNPYADYSFASLCDFLSDYKLPRDIGEKYEYSNLGAGLLGSLLARRAGTSYESLLTERILHPLGLTETAITLSPQLQSHLAAPYGESMEPQRNWDFDALAGAGAIRSTARDLLTFLAANLHLTESALWPAMQSMQQPARSTDIPRTRIGLAWHITDRNGLRIIWHNGMTGGYASFIGFDPTNRAGVVVLANAAQSEDDLGFHLLDPKQALAKAKARADQPEARVPTAQLDRYVGRYQLAPGVFFNLRREGNRLMAQLTGQSYYEIYPKSSTSFFYKVVDAQINFNTDAAGQAQSLTLHQNGIDQTAEKISDAAPAERRAIRLDPATFSNYTGEYTLTPGAVFTIRASGDRLLARLTGQTYLQIFPESATEFFYKAVEAQLTFVKGADGKMSALILHQNGLDQRAERTK